MMKRLLTTIMLLVSITVLSYGKYEVETRYFMVECENQLQTNAIIIEDNATDTYSISLKESLGLYKRWSASGNIVIIDSTATSANFYSNGPLKGRIYYYFDDDPLDSCKCGLGSVSIDVYKHFDAAAKYGVEIIGPDCITDGDSVVFSVNPILTANLYAGIGMDLYNWNIFDSLSAPYVKSIPYVSGDSSSVTFTVGKMTGNDSITIRVGLANEEYRIVKYLGKAAPMPIVHDTCLPYDQNSFEVNVFNEEYPDLVYDWTWPTNWQIQYIDNDTKAHVRFLTKIMGEEGTFSVTSSFPSQNNECTYASQSVFNLTRSWGKNSYITPIDTIVVNNCDLIEFELKDAYLTENSYPTWEKPENWISEGDEHHSTFMARPINTTNDIDSIIVWENVCNHKDSAKVYVYIKPAQVLSITDHGCLENGQNYTFTIQSLSAGPTPMGYIWVFGNDTIQNSTSNSVTINADVSKNTLSVTSIGRFGYESETTTFNLNYKPIAPAGIVVHNECIAYNMIDTVILSILNPTPNQKYAWTIPNEWRILDTISIPNTLAVSVRLISNGIEGSYSISAKGINDGYMCYESEATESRVTISAIDDYIIVESGSWGMCKLSTRYFNNSSSVDWYLLEDGEIESDFSVTRYPFMPDGVVSNTNVPCVIDGTHYTLVADVVYLDGCRTRLQYGFLISNLESISLHNVPARPTAKSHTPSPEHKLYLSPNPALHTIKIDLTDKETNKAKLYIVDIQGRMIASNIEFDLGTSYDVSTLPSGQYLVCIQQDEMRYAEIFIKQ